MKADILVYPFYQIFGKIIRGKGASQEAGHGDAYLYGGKEGSRFLYQLQQPAGLFIPFLLKPAQLRPIQGNHRDFRGSKKCIQ